MCRAEFLVLCALAGALAPGAAEGGVLTVNPDGSADFETLGRPWPALVLERKLER